MNLELSPEQTALAEALDRLLRKLSPAERVRSAWTPRSSGWRASTARKRAFFSSGHSRSISCSTARCEARQAPQPGGRHRERGRQRGGEEHPRT